MRTFVSIAAGQVGKHEQGGNNRGPDVEKYQRATWMPEEEIKKGFAWCAAFVCWVIQQWMGSVEGRNFLAERTSFRRCKDASAFGFEKWGRDNGCTIVLPTQLAKAGDIVIFDFNGPNVPGGGHIGIVETDQIAGQLVNTIEGNTGTAGLRETTDGSDGVFRKARKSNTVKCYVRIQERKP